MKKKQNKHKAAKRAIYKSSNKQEINKIKKIKKHLKKRPNDLISEKVLEKLTKKTCI